MVGVRVAGILLFVFGMFGGWPDGSEGVLGALSAGSIRYLLITVTLAATGVYAFIASLGK